mgnify:FL=1
MILEKGRTLKTITLPLNQADYIRIKGISLSRYVQNKLYEEMQKDKNKEEVKTIPQIE